MDEYSSYLMVGPADSPGSMGSKDNHVAKPGRRSWDESPIDNLPFKVLYCTYLRTSVGHRDLSV